MQRGAALRPAVGGFPYLAEVLRRAGVPGCGAMFEIYRLARVRF